MTPEWADRLRGHLPERSIERLGTRLAESGSIEAATAGDRAHLARCARCRRLLVGYRRLDSVLSGPWEDRTTSVAATTAAAGGAVAGRAAGGTPSSVPNLLPRRERVRAGHASRRERRAARALPALLLVAAVALLAVGGFIVTRPNAPAATPSPSTSPSPWSHVVSRFHGIFNGWSPDGAHFLFAADDGLAVVDTAGRSVARGGVTVDWLDASHLIDRDGHVFAIAAGRWSGSETNEDVKANGHGTAAIVTNWSGCLGDPPQNEASVSWYENGAIGATGDPVRVFGWSADGRLALIGVSDCTKRPSPSPGADWKGTVEVVEFPGHAVVGRVDDVRGALAFNPSATWLAAASDGDVRLLDIASGKVTTLTGVRLLGWLDDGHVFYTRHGSSEAQLRDVATGLDVPSGLADGEWAIPSSTGSLLVLDVATGAAKRVLGSDRRPLIELSSLNVVVRAPADVESYADYGTWPEGTPWSPDGRFLMLPAPQAPDYVLVKVGAEGPRP